MLCFNKTTVYNVRQKTEKKAENTVGRVNLIVDIKPTMLMAPK